MPVTLEDLYTSIRALFINSPQVPLEDLAFLDKQLRDLARHAWTSRVLDAAAEAGFNVDLVPYTGRLAGGFLASFLMPAVDNGRGDVVDLGGGFDRESARRHAAKAVFHRLSDEKKEELGWLP